MTREEAIDQLQDAKSGYKEYLSGEAIDLAIKALEQEPIKSVLEDIKAIINTSNRGTCDYFIVDEIEKYINKHISGSEVENGNDV